VVLSPEEEYDKQLELWMIHLKASIRKMSDEGYKDEVLVPEEMVSQQHPSSTSIGTNNAIS
jgi:hypothetical protein